MRSFPQINFKSFVTFIMIAPVLNLRLSDNDKSSFYWIDLKYFLSFYIYHDKLKHSWPDVDFCSCLHLTRKYFGLWHKHVKLHKIEFQFSIEAYNISGLKI